MPLWPHCCTEVRDHKNLPGEQELTSSTGFVLSFAFIKSQNTVNCTKVRQWVKKAKRHSTIRIEI